MSDDDNVIAFPKLGPDWSDADLAALEADLTAALGYPVALVSGAGDHVLTIRASGLEGLDRVCNVIMTGAKVLSER